MSEVSCTAWAYDINHGRGATPTVERRRPGWILAEIVEPGAVVAEIARREDVCTSLVYKWRRAAQPEYRKRRPLRIFAGDHRDAAAGVANVAAPERPSVAYPEQPAV